MVPDLRVSDIVFLDPRSVEEVKDTVEEVEKREQAEEAQRRGGESYDPPIDVTLYDPGVMEQRYYYGPVPDAVMVIKLENAGRTAAHNVSGTIPEILPGRSGSFRVATVIHLEPKEDVTLKYDFITPAGFPTSGEWVVRGG